MNSRAWVSIILSLILLSSCNEFGKVLNKYGYTELKTPTKFPTPGSIIKIDYTALRLLNYPIGLDIVCTTDNSLGSDFKPLESPTIDYSLVKDVENTFTIKGDYLKLIGLNGDYKNVNKINLTLSNATILQLSTHSVYATIPKRSNFCQQAIDDYIKNQIPVTMVTSALKANAKYVVDFDSSTSLSASEKEKIMEGLALELKLEYKAKGSYTIEGDDLIYGIREDARLAAIRSDRSVTSFVVPVSPKEGISVGVIDNVKVLPTLTTTKRVSISLSDIVDPKKKPIEIIPRTTGGLEVLKKEGVPIQTPIFPSPRAPE